MQYWFSTVTLPDREVLNVVQKIRSAKQRCYLVTNQEKYRATYMRENLGFKDTFDGCFFSYKIGYKKSDKEFFEFILRSLNLPPDETTYFDNDEKNVFVAKSIGIQAWLWTGVSSLAQLR